MLHALVFDTDLPLLTEGTPSRAVPARTRMAGLSLLERAVFMAWNTGAARVTVIAREGFSPAEAARLGRRGQVGISSPDAPLRIEDEDGLLILSASVLPAPRALAELLDSFRASDRSVRLQGADPAVSGPAVLESAAVTLAPCGAAEWVRAALRSPRCELIRVPADELRYLESSAAVAAADRRLYEDLATSCDGYLDRVFNRHLSRWFTRRIINFPISPNQVTAIHFVLGMAAVALFWGGSYWPGVLGAVLLQLSVALDCTDGEVARLKYQFSKLGGWLDLWADNLVHMALFAAIAHGAVSHLGVPTAVTLGALAVVGVLLCMLVLFNMARFQSCAPGGGSLAIMERMGDARSRSRPRPSLVARIINEATSRDFTAIVALLAVFGRLEWMAWLAGIGSHVFWIVLLILRLLPRRNPRTTPG